MPRKPLDGREHGARLILSGGTFYVIAKSAPLGAPNGLARSAPDYLSLSQPVPPSCVSPSNLRRAKRGGAPAPRSGAEGARTQAAKRLRISSSEMLRRRRSVFFQAVAFRACEASKRAFNRLMPISTSVGGLFSGGAGEAEEEGDS